MAEPAENLALLRRYLKTLESGPTGDELAQFFAPEVVLEIFPSKFFPSGSRDNLAGIFAAAERGKKVMTSQKYEIRDELASGGKVALEIDWTGALAVPFQTIPKGGQCGRTSLHCSDARTAKSFRSATTIATSRSRLVRAPQRLLSIRWLRHRFRPRLPIRRPRRALQRIRLVI